MYRNSRYKQRSRSRSRTRTPYRNSRSRSRSHSRPRNRERNRNLYSSGSRSPMSTRKRHVGSRDNPRPCRCLGVFGLSTLTTEEEIRDIFSKYGTIERVVIVIDAKVKMHRTKFDFGRIWSTVPYNLKVLGKVCQIFVSGVDYRALDLERTRLSICVGQRPWATSLYFEIIRDTQ